MIEVATYYPDRSVSKPYKDRKPETPGKSLASKLREQRKAMCLQSRVKKNHIRLLVHKLLTTTDKAYLVSCDSFRESILLPKRYTTLGFKRGTNQIHADIPFWLYGKICEQHR